MSYTGSLSNSDRHIWSQQLLPSLVWKGNGVEWTKEGLKVDPCDVSLEKLRSGVGLGSILLAILSSLIFIICQTEK